MPTSDIVTIQIEHDRDIDLHHMLAVSFADADGTIQTSRNRLRLLFPPDFQERLRWYFEDFRSYQTDPAQQRAHAIAQEIVELGHDLFRAVFGSTKTAQLWEQLRGSLNRARFEITSTRDIDTIIPWEAMRDPSTGAVLSTHCHAFVRSCVLRRTVTFSTTAAPRRVLLAIARPLLEDDVPFRVVANRLMNAATDNVIVDVLRPATLEQLRTVIEDAASEERPYHTVHFDGHGIYEDLIAKTSGQPETSPRGYVLFETANPLGGAQPVDGALLGEMLSSSQIPFLVVNACRSAHAEAQPNPDSASDEDYASLALPSFAQEAFAAGLRGVVAMRQNVYVDTASVFVGRLYAELSQNVGLGPSVSRARAALEESAGERDGVQDWLIPLVYEVSAADDVRAPLRATPNKYTLTPSSTRSGIHVVPPCDRVDLRCDLIGQDHTLLTIDRAFDASSVFGLYGSAGAGKTSLAIEFGRWYRRTRGTSGPVIVTSFAAVDDPHALLTTVANLLGASPYEPDQRASIESFFEIVRKHHFLWIWDGVEYLFRDWAARGRWSGSEVSQFGRFVTNLHEAGPAKVLLTSRATLEAEFPRLQHRFVDKLDLAESEEVVMSLLRTRGEAIGARDIWEPLITCADGHPLVLKGLVLQALEEGLTAHSSIDSFARSFDRGLPVLKHLISADAGACILCSLDRSEVASLSEVQRAVLALCHLHRRFVHLLTMFDMLTPGTAHTLQGRHVDIGINDEVALEAALTAVSDRGLMAKWSRTNYQPHPALHVYVEPLFRLLFPDRDVAVRGFVVSTLQTIMGSFEQISLGDRRAVTLLVLDKPNMLNARAHAIEIGLWQEAFFLTEALSSAAHVLNDPFDVTDLYLELKPHYVTSTGGPMAGTEWQWASILEAEALAAYKARRYDDAEALLRTVIDVVAPSDLPTAGSKQESQRTLISCLTLLGEVFVKQRRTEAISTLEAAWALARQLDEDLPYVALALAKGYVTAASPDVLKATALARMALERRLSPEDRVKALGILGQCAVLSADRARHDGEGEASRMEALRGQELLREAMRISIPTKYDDLLAICHSLGDACNLSGDWELALSYHQQALRYAKVTGDPSNIAFAQRAVGRALLSTGQFMGALTYLESLADEVGGIGVSERADLLNELLIRDASRLFSESNRLRDLGADDGGDGADGKTGDARALRAIAECDRILNSGATDRRSLAAYVKASALWRLRLQAAERGALDDIVGFCKESIAVLDEGLRFEGRFSPLRTAMEISRADCETALGGAFKTAGKSRDALDAYRRAIKGFARAETGAARSAAQKHERQAVSLSLAGTTRCFLAISRIHSEERRLKLAVSALGRAVETAKRHMRLVGDEAACDMLVEAMRQLGDMQSREHLRSALATFNELAAFCSLPSVQLCGRRSSLASTLVRRGWVHFKLRQWSRARRDYTDALTTYEEVEDRNAVMHTDIGDAYRALSGIPGTAPEMAIDYLTKAQTAFKEAIRLAASDSETTRDLMTRQIGTITTLAWALRHSARDQARSLFEEAASTARSAVLPVMNSPDDDVLWAHADAMKWFALFEGVTGNFADSVPKLTECLNVIERLRDLHPLDAKIVHDQAHALMFLGQAYLATGRPEQAEEALFKAFASVQEALQQSPSSKEYRRTFQEIARHFTPRPTLRDIGLAE